MVRFQSIFWVSAQFFLVFLLLLLSRPWHGSGISILLGGLGSALALWVFVHNPPGNFRIRPEPKAHARLITSGPYRWVRHPMYSALLLVTAALPSQSSQILPWAAWGLLGVVLTFKSSLEERLLQQHWSEYAAYRTHTHRFIPFLW
ncbi:MAG: isoprenylcysteine carboxylmethyltransferase family protein [Ferrovum sp.]|nr:isoprenylcysteine carboxylmethyltransferase family protein [Ferrovum sp.]